MARPIEHDRDEVLDAAMHAFWRQGFGATSVADLVDATGMTTRSMYNVFGDKDGFFLAALERFKAEILDRFAYRPLEESRGRDALRTYLLDYLANPRGLLANGCLFVNTLNEQDTISPRCRSLTIEHFDHLEGLLAQKLDEAVEDGEFDGDVPLTAKAIVVMVQGGATYVRAGGDGNELVDVFTDLFERLGIA